MNIYTLRIHVSNICLHWNVIKTSLKVGSWQAEKTISLQHIFAERGTWVTSSEIQQKCRSSSVCEKLPTKISAKAWRSRGASRSVTVSPLRNNEDMEKPWENTGKTHGNTRGKPWENKGNTVGKPWENHGKTMGKAGENDETWNGNTSKYVVFTGSCADFWSHSCWC